VADLTLVVDAATDPGKASFIALGKAILDFSKESVKAFAEQERADVQLSASLKQLGYDAKALTPVLKDQATAFQQTLGVSDDMVESMQALMIRYGTAPKDIKGATQAILDYAAATGKDADSATQQLMRSIENGGKGLSKMGIVIDATGDKSKDLAAAVEAMGEKFGGAAAAQGETFTGKMNKMEQQLGEVKEAFGSMIVTMEGKLHIVEQLSEGFKNLAYWMSDDGSNARERRADNQELMKLLEKQDHLRTLIRDGEAKDLLFSDLLVAGRREELGVIDDQIAAIQAKQRAEQAADAAKKAGADISGVGASAEALAMEGAAAMKAREKEAAKELKMETARANKLGEIAQHEAEEEDKERRKKEARYEKEEEDRRKAIDKELEDYEERTNAEKRIAEKEREVWAKSDEVQAEASSKQFTKLVEQQQVATERLKAEGTATMIAAGNAVGFAFVNSMEQQFAKTDKGGELDLGEVVKALLPVLIGAALMFTPAAPFAPLIAGAVGLAVSRFHSGGPVGEEHIPRFHDGGEVPALLQTGEVVWSRDDVARNGGAGNVDRMRKRSGGGGGGGITINMSALDSRSAREFFEDPGGRGFRDAIKAGRGPLPALFRRGR
jgi:hypothetical protein